MKREHERENNDELIVRYLTGEATPEEAMVLHEWLEDAENKAYFEQLSAIWSVTHPSHNNITFKKDNAWSHIQPGLIQGKSGQVYVFPQSTFLKIAASVTLVIFAGLALYIRFGKDTLQTAETADKQKEIFFADQSQATLYHNTHLSYPQEFENDFRKVDMAKGEAFFSITPDKKRPFIIHTAIADIKVLGTEFNVVTNNDHVEVSVRSGVVYLSNRRGGVYLQKGISATVTSTDGIIETSNKANINAWAYATRRLEFRETPVRDIARDVEKTFGCTIVLSDNNIGNCKLTATFDNDSADKIVHLVAETLSLTLKKNGRIFTLEGEGCP